MDTKKGFTLIELLIVIAIIGILAGVILVSTSNSNIKAKEAKHIAYIAQMKKLVENSIALGYLPKTEGQVGCLGDYGGNNCWGGTPGYVNNSHFDDELRKLGSLPVGQYSPYAPSNGMGMIIQDHANSVPKSMNVYVYVGPNKASETCPKLGMNNSGTDSCAKAIF